MKINSIDGRALFSDKIILAPMVRAGRLPLRLLALEHGADLVYTEEIVDQKLLNSTRTVNDLLGTIDFGIESESPVLRICPSKEADRCVLQIGSSDPERAAAVAKLIGSDVAAIDLNMGCPKPFSIAGGMGAALLTEPEKAKQILTAMVANASIPVSCKIRVLDKREDTLSLIREIERCGVSAIAVHGRRRDERPGNANREDEIAEIARMANVPIIANGGSSVVKEYVDIERFHQRTGASSVMLARRALNTPSIFRKEGGRLAMDEEIRRFLDVAMEYDESFTLTKYVIQRILGGEQEFDPRGRETVLATTIEEIARAWGMQQRFDEWRSRRRGLKRKIVVDDHPDNRNSGVQYIDLTFPPKRLSKNCSAGSPKCLLNIICDERNIKRPKYEITQRDVDRRYEAVINVDGRRFGSRLGQPNKKMAEQVAALVALHGLDLRHRLTGDWEDN